MKNERQKALNNLGYKNTTASENIYNNVLKKLM